MFKNFPKKVQIKEVGPRDGLQNEKAVITTQDKFEYVKLLSLSGLQNVEVTSFVKPSAIPQMSDAKELYQLVSEKLDASLSYPCLVPNLKGMETAMDLGVKEIALFSATSSEFTKKNINSTVEESFVKMKEVAELALKNKIKIRGYVSTAFGCPYAGEIGVSKLEEVTKRFFDLGVYEVSIGDTIGVATPKQVESYLDVICKSFSKDKLAMHFHDTRGMAISNILVSLGFGISVYDSASGGLGGCPYAKGATGNVATEDLLYLFKSLGIETGVDLDKIIEASKFILSKVSKESPSKFFNAYTKTGY